MPLERYPQPGFELLDDQIPLWRFMSARWFIDLIETRTVYFRRSDLFPDDENEGLPPADYVRGVVASMGPGHSFEHTWDTLRDDRKGSYVSCWTVDETVHMWSKFAKEGVAIQSKSGLLKTALDAMPSRAMLGYVRYSLRHAHFNILDFITTKRPEFRLEQEVRALLWEKGRSACGPGYPNTQPDGIAYAVDVPALIEKVIVSPFAPTRVFEAAGRVITEQGFNIPVERSRFTGFDHLLPSAEDITKYSLT